MPPKISGRQRAELFGEDGQSGDIGFLRGQADTMLRSRPRGRISQAAGRPGQRRLAGANEFARIARSQGRSINDVGRDFARGIKSMTENLTARQAMNLYSRSVAPGGRDDFFREAVNIGRRMGR